MEAHTCERFFFETPKTLLMRINITSDIVIYTFLGEFIIGRITVHCTGCYFVQQKEKGKRLNSIVKEGSQEEAYAIVQ